MEKEAGETGITIRIAEARKHGTRQRKKCTGTTNNTDFVLSKNKNTYRLNSTVFTQRMKSINGCGNHSDQMFAVWPAATDVCNGMGAGEQSTGAGMCIHVDCLWVGSLCAVFASGKCGTEPKRQGSGFPNHIRKYISDRFRQKFV